MGGDGGRKWGGRGDRRGTGTGIRTCRIQNPGRILKLKQYSKGIFAIRAGLHIIFSVFTLLLVSHYFISFSSGTCH